LEAEKLFVNILLADLVSVVGLDDQSVQMGVNVILASDFLVDKVVLALVAENDVDLLGSRTANVGAKHDFIGGVAVHLSWHKITVENLHVATAAVNVLLVLDGELDDQGLSLIAEGLEFARESVEASIFRGLET
jgi:hypothetical protein